MGTTTFRDVRDELKGCLNKRLLCWASQKSLSPPVKLSRGRAEGFEPDSTLLNADAGTFLAASGDLIQTELTGTNVMDLMVALKS